MSQHVLSTLSQHRPAEAGGVEAWREKYVDLLDESFHGHQPGGA